MGSQEHHADHCTHSRRYNRIGWQFFWMFPLIVSFPLLVNLLVGSAVQLGDHKGKEVAASCINHFVLAQVLSPSLPQTFFSQATGSKRPLSLRQTTGVIFRSKVSQPLADQTPSSAAPKTSLSANVKKNGVY
jgi:hypothetical protein